MTIVKQTKWRSEPSSARSKNATSAKRGKQATDASAGKHATDAGVGKHTTDASAGGAGRRRPRLGLVLLLIGSTNDTFVLVS